MALNGTAIAENDATNTTNVKTQNTFAPVLYTPRLRLRFCDESTDDDPLYCLEVLAKPEVIAMNGDGPYGLTRDTWDEIHGLWHLDPATNNGETRFIIYIIEFRETGKPLGFVSLRQTYKIPDIGYMLEPPYWGNGYATEAAREVLRHATEDVGLKKVIGLPNRGNTKSRKILEKIGLDYVGMHWVDGVKPKEGDEVDDGAQEVLKLPGMVEKIWIETREETHVENSKDNKDRGLD